MNLVRNEPGGSPAFGEPFPESIGILNREYVRPTEEHFRIPDGPHHRMLGEQLTVVYRDDETLHSVAVIGAPARVADAGAAVDWLTERMTGPGGGQWAELDPGPLGGRAVCLGAEGATYCYWADARMVGFLLTPSLGVEAMRKSFVMIRNAVER
ncbi:hypothetical protein [Planobispora takensis]|uniref:Uncharacterized protein n=1 Tax=Planobispora takensis TaxID=1367882 RepID=A0A8J3SVZ6_9ACTN|nr:hypothetical protein [Planobispora takensis]GIH99790.1 hypothetical protein Pta02_17990 [Planobispora takensis]